MRADAPNSTPGSGTHHSPPNLLTADGQTSQQSREVKSAFGTPRGGLTDQTAHHRSDEPITSDG
jgi:hypothetical protein